VGHVFHNGFSIIDVRDPKNPAFVKHMPQPGKTWSQHVQTHGDIMMVNNMRSMLDAHEYYKGSIGNKIDVTAIEQDYSAGIRIYDISDRENPREISFLKIPGLGVHRVWWDGGDWAYVSAVPPGFTDDIFFIVDVRNLEKPEVVSKWWVPGMNRDAGEEQSWNPDLRYALHHAIIKGDLAAAAWRDGGVVLLDVADRHNPKMLAHDNLCPPFAGHTHNCLPLPGRGLMFVVEEALFDHCGDGVKRNWIYDIREPTKPITIASTPLPSDADYKAKPGQFGPHNLYENRSEGYQSEELIFVSYQNAGVRVYNISDPFRPEEVAACVPPAPETMLDPTPRAHPVIDTVDVFVDKQGLAYATDMNAGLYIMEVEGI
ncbi:MAG: hypothetical protein GY933_01805, partial [Hyphomicrobiales bacterium]|nr:hypothetical protein [Hyphomicrobiales bacterium]